MSISSQVARSSWALCLAVSLLGFLPALNAWAEDIDVFASSLSADAAEETRPNIIIVLDNTSNWSANNQQFPEADVSFNGDTYTAGVMGEFELAAIQTALAAVADQGPFNISILSFTTAGTANENGGLVRFDLRHYQGDSSAYDGAVSVKTGLETVLQTAFVNVRNPDEKRNSNTEFGNLAYDVYNYLTGGDQSFAGAGTLASLADEDAYTAFYNTFESPLDDAAICADTYLIWVGNPNQNGPARDDLANSTNLRRLYLDAGGIPAALAGDASGEGLQMPEYAGQRGGATTESKGYTPYCFRRRQECDAAIDPPDTATYPNLALTDIGTDCSVAGACSCSNTAPQTTYLDPLTGVTDDCPLDDRGRQTFSFDVQGPLTGSEGYARSGNYIDGKDYNFDDWTKFFYEYGIPIPGSDGLRTRVTTFTIDVFDKAPDEEFSALLDSAATVGGGYRVAANDFSQLVAAFNQIVSDILAVNSSFAAVTLPLSASKRSEAQNKVFIASFTPDPKRRPRWLGNLKQYKLGFDANGNVDLVDNNGTKAINPVTGIVADCAESIWTESSGTYFDGLGVLDPDVGSCETSSENFNSDLPDGPHVAKGGAAQKMRDNATSQVSDRGLWVVGDSRTDSGAISGDRDALDSYATTAIPEVVRNYLEGENTGLVGGDRWSVDDGTRVYVDDPSTPYYIASGALLSPTMPSEGLRPTIHGDVVHSQPVTITYNASTVKIFYGANDGFYRMVDANSGEEDWGFVAYEHLDKLQRLYDNSPTIEYSNTSGIISADILDEPKPYFMDGLTGSYITYSNGAVANAYIYPTMRRGGNWIYALDVGPDANGAPPAQPQPLWKYELTGQSWGRPVVGRVNGYSNPVLIVGGGYDACLDPDGGEADFNYSTLCGSGTVTGSQIVILDALTGTEVRVFDTEIDGPVVADVAAIDLDAAVDPVFDFAYAVDAKGAVYRINFASILSGVISYATTSAGWSVDKIAEVSSSGATELRFLNQPAPNPFKDESGNRHVYVVVGAGDRERPMEADYPYAQEVDYYMYAVLDRLFDWDHDGNPLTPSTPLGRGAVTIPDARAGSGAVCAPSDAVPCYGFLDVTGGLNATTALTPTGNIYQYSGWMFELPDRGEQIINRAIVETGIVFFNSYQPAGTGGFCAAFGQAKGYRIPLFSPTEVVDSLFNVPGLPPPPSYETVCIDKGDGSCETKTVCFYCGDADGDGDSNPAEEIPYAITPQIQQGYQVRKGPDN